MSQQSNDEDDERVVFGESTIEPNWSQYMVVNTADDEEMLRVDLEEDVIVVHEDYTKSGEEERIDVNEKFREVLEDHWML